jgi:hypothetical protein
MDADRLVGLPEIVPRHARFWRALFGDGLPGGTAV